MRGFGDVDGKGIARGGYFLFLLSFLLPVLANFTYIFPFRQNKRRKLLLLPTFLNNLINKQTNFQFLLILPHFLYFLLQGNGFPLVHLKLILIPIQFLIKTFLSQIVFQQLIYHQQRSLPYAIFIEGEGEDIFVFGDDC